jgi:hypothetical protein
MLSEKTIIDKIEIIESKSIQIREANIIEKDGIPIAKTFHRYVLNPGDDISQENEKVKGIAALFWTPEIIEEYKKSIQTRLIPSNTQTNGSV